MVPLIVLTLKRDLKSPLNEDVGSEKHFVYLKFAQDIVSFVHCCRAGSCQYLALVLVFLYLVIFCNRHF